MRVLVVNAGSSSLKLAVVEDGRRVDADHRRALGREEHDEPIASFVDAARPVDAVGHRVVHGGPGTPRAVRVDDDLLDYLDSIKDLAPLHNPRAVAGIRACAAACRGPGGRLLRHRLPRRPAGRGPHLRAAPRVEPALAAAALRLPRSLPRVRRTAGRVPGRPPARPCAWCRVTWAPARRWRRSWVAGRWTRRWASPRPGAGDGHASGASTLVCCSGCWSTAGSPSRAGHGARARVRAEGALRNRDDLRDVLAARAGDEDAALAYDVFVHRLPARSGR